MKRIYFILILVIGMLGSSCEAVNNNIDPLFDALTNDSNYTYLIKYDDGENIYQRKVLYNSGTLQVNVDNEEIKMLTLCYDELANREYIVKTLNNDSSIVVEYSSFEFMTLKNNYLDEVYLNVLDTVDFIKSGNGYALKEDCLKSVSRELFDLTVVGELTSMNISLGDGCIKNLNAEIVVLDKEYSVDIEFYAFGTTVIDIPKIDDNNSISQIIPSSKLIKVNSGTSLNEALDGVYVTVVYENGDKETLGIEDLTYQCEDFNKDNPGTYEIVINVLNEEVKINIEVLGNSYYLPDSLETLNSYADKKGLSYGLPSTGNSKALVIPVEFIDYKAPANMKTNLEKAFFGTSEDTGWESLTSYYNKASYGKLNIEGTVLDVYNTNKTSTYYNRKYIAGEDADYLIIKDVLEYYDNQINYDEYDSNNDGYIDALYIVYTAPIDYVDESSMWWAYTYEYYTEDYEFYDNVEADFYCFFGYDFLFEETVSGKYIKLNTETIIHESGHLLGLDDYYDYDDSKGPDGGLGGGDMMDYNVGDHNPFSKILMGWVIPYVVTDSCSITLDTFYSSGQCILLIDEFSTIFDEYYLIDYYSPDGLNKLEAGYNGLFSSSGIRVYHVDATLTTEEIYSALDIYKYNNSDTVHKLIKLVQASGKNTIENGEYSTNADLFKFNKEYTLNSWYSNNNVVFKFNAEALNNTSVRIDIKKQ